LSAGPRTALGREKCAEAKLVHGRETNVARRRRVEAMNRLRNLVEIGVRGGFLKRRIAGRNGSR